MKEEHARIAAAAREIAHEAARLSWALDSALSLQNKARKGYRASPLLGDAPWDVVEADGKVEVALAAVLKAYGYRVSYFEARPLGRLG